MSGIEKLPQVTIMEYNPQTRQPEPKIYACNPKTHTNCSQAYMDNFQKCTEDYAGPSCNTEGMSFLDNVRAFCIGLNTSSEIDKVVRNSNFCRAVQ